MKSAPDAKASGLFLQLYFARGEPPSEARDGEHNKKPRKIVPYNNNNKKPHPPSSPLSSPLDFFLGNAAAQKIKIYLEPYTEQSISEVS